MRERLLIIAGILMLAAAPVLADDVPPIEQVPPDDLTQVPFECVMPSLPSPLMLNNGATLPDVLKGGMDTLNDFVGNSAVYLNCMGNKVKQNATILYQRLMDAARAKMNDAQDKKDPAI